jgi:hypothetical protein
MSPASFERTSAIAAHYDFARNPSTQDLGTYLFPFGLVFLVGGAFIFFWSAVGRLQDPREHGSITHLQFK